MNRLHWLVSVAIASLTISPISANEDVPATARTISLAESTTRIATWSEDNRHHYAIDNGSGQWRIVHDTSYQLPLRYASFDPLAGTPVLPPMLTATLPQLPGPGTINQDLEQVYIVQFMTQPLEQYRAAVRNNGGEIYKYLPNHAYLVSLDPRERDQISRLPFVRWVGLYHPAYKLDAILLAELEQLGIKAAPRRVNVMVHERGPQQKNSVAKQIAALGGAVDLLIPEGFRLEATLDGQQLLAVAALPEVLWIDPWTEREEDMDLARDIGGANQIEAIAGYAGQGVRGEVMDGNLFDNHVAFQAIPPVYHGPRAGSDDHGTGTYGIIFADGSGDPAGRGMLPLAQGIFADFGQLSNRYAHTAELVQAPYFGVFQSNSWGNTPTTSYTSLSAELDDIIFINDLIITQSQSNQNSQLSRPQAWGKNVVSVGGINHQETLSRDDDFWSGASIGPAADGRIKPDLCHFYDTIYTTDDTISGFRNFCCTSGATPIVAGHFGLFFQMWSEGIFGNPVNPDASVFDNRPHSTTARAMVINHASAYSFSGTNDNLTRTHQGWGMPDVARIYEARNNVFVVNEEIVLENLESASFDLGVNAGSPEFRATLVYMEPMGTTSSSIHRINDLSLRVTSPDGMIYWGNNGLLSGNWSIAGGNSNTIDPVENVFIQNPASGTWTVEVIASEINEDAHPDTAELDADFALVVSGVNQVTATLDSFQVVQGVLLSGGLPEAVQSDDQYLQVNAASEFDDVPVSVEFEGLLSSSTPQSLSVVLEAQVNTVGLSQRIEMFNFQSEEFEQVDERPATFATDNMVAIDVSDGIGNYVDNGTGRVRARVSWTASSPTLLFPWEINIDQVGWNAN